MTALVSASTDAVRTSSILPSLLLLRPADYAVPLCSRSASQLQVQAMARRSRAMSIGLAHDKAEGPRQLHPEATLPVPSSSHTVSSLRTKKSSHSAILRVLRKLRSPGNSDDEDDDGCPEGDEDNSDLDFGCSGLNSCIDLDASKSSFDEELHISLPPQQHQHQDAQTSLELPTRSASIAVSRYTIFSASIFTLLFHLHMPISLHTFLLNLRRALSSTCFPSYSRLTAVYYNLLTRCYLQSLPGLDDLFHIIHQPLLLRMHPLNTHFLLPISQCSQFILYKSNVTHLNKQSNKQSDKQEILHCSRFS